MSSSKVVRGRKPPPPSANLSADLCDGPKAVPGQQRRPPAPGSHPRQPPPFGSPRALARAVPHVVFVVDAASASGRHGDPETAAMRIVAAALRVLVYLHLHVHPRLTWGFEVVDSSAAAALQAPIRDARLALDLAPSALERLRAAAAAGIARRDALPPPRTPASLPLLAQICRRMLVEAPWHSGPVGPLQSPLRPGAARLAAMRGSIRVRSFMIVLARAPADTHELTQMLGIDAAGLAPVATTHARLLDLLLLARDEVASVAAWEDLASQRVSLSWTDVASPAPSPEALAVRAGLAAVLRASGGTFLGIDELFRDHAWVGMARSLAAMHPRTIEATFARSIVQAATPQDLVRAWDRLTVQIGTARFPCLLRTKISLAAIPGVQGTPLHAVAAHADSLGLQFTYLSGRTDRPSTAHATTTSASPFAINNDSVIEMLHLCNIQFLHDDMFSPHAFACIRDVPLTSNGSLPRDLALFGFEALSLTLTQLQAALVFKLSMYIDDGNKVVEDKAQSLENPFSLATPHVDDGGNADHDINTPKRQVESRLVVLAPLLPSLLVLRVLNRDVEQDVLEHASHALEASTSSDDVMSGAVDVARAWTSPEPFTPLMNFLKRGLWDADHSQELYRLCFGLWRPEAVRPAEPDPTNPLQVTKSKPMSASTSADAQSTSFHIDASVIHSLPQTIESVFAEFKTAYLDALYERKPLSEVVAKTMHDQYTRINTITSTRSKDAQAGSTDLITLLSSQMVLSLSEIESRHQNLPNALANAFNEMVASRHESEIHYDDGGGDHDRVARIDAALMSLAEDERPIARAWIERIQTHAQNNGMRGKSAIRAEITRQARRLRTTEALLQIVLWMRCLEVHGQSGVSIPDAVLGTSKPDMKNVAVGELGDVTGDGKKKGKKPSNKKAKKQGKQNACLSVSDQRELAVKNIGALMDRVCIWSIGHGGASSGLAHDGLHGDDKADTDSLWHRFVAPIVLVLFQKLLPDVVDLLATKAGGPPAESSQKGASAKTLDGSQRSFMGVSPFFKNKVQSFSANGVAAAAETAMAKKSGTSKSREAGGSLTRASTVANTGPSSSTSLSSITMQRTVSASGSQLQAPERKTRRALLDLSRRQVHVAPKTRKPQASSTTDVAQSGVAVTLSGKQKELKKSHGGGGTCLTLEQFLASETTVEPKVDTNAGNVGSNHTLLAPATPAANRISVMAFGDRTPCSALRGGNVGGSSNRSPPEVAETPSASRDRRRRRQQRDDVVAAITADQTIKQGMGAASSDDDDDDDDGGGAMLIPGSPLHRPLKRVKQWRNQL